MYAPVTANNTECSKSDPLRNSPYTQRRYCPAGGAFSTAIALRSKVVATSPPRLSRPSISALVLTIYHELQAKREVWREVCIKSAASSKDSEFTELDRDRSLQDKGSLAEVVEEDARRMIPTTVCLRKQPRARLLPYRDLPPRSVDRDNSNLYMASTIDLELEALKPKLGGCRGEGSVEGPEQPLGLPRRRGASKPEA